ncbi:IS1595 family transposase [Methylocystis sp.]|uniref:IS1595 family transposase n=1 Tax=Methylocystis sp. TaxID=1911079 RepID=UPI003DA3A5E9
MSTKPPTLKQFQKRFPDDDVCLEHIMRVRYGQRFACESCGREAHFYRVKGRRCYECEHCGYQVYPTAGTPFEKTRTPLTDWFFVMFLFTASRNGVAAKEVQRQIGVTYKTAWRMCKEIRTYMGTVDGDRPLGGVRPFSPIVEVDKTFIGGKDRQGQDDKAVVLGMMERHGDVVTRLVAGRNGRHVMPQVTTWVIEGSRVMTDDARVFQHMDKEGFVHESVNHGEKEYVRGEAHTNNIEAFWSNLKRGIQGTYISVSKKHLQKYLWEFEYRHNLRHAPHLMLPCLMVGFAKPARRA